LTVSLAFASSSRRDQYGKNQSQTFLGYVLQCGRWLCTGFDVSARNQAEAAAIEAQVGRNPWEASAGKGDIEINPWLEIAPDDTVTIRVAQYEMGQGTFTSWSKMIVEELECDWSKVRAEH
jgi:hypothetical protein